jgi:predicted RNase H-like HicB family nuclease
MAKKLIHRFAVGPTDYGKWLAISDHNPYFVFQGESPEEVEATAHRALDFYFGVSGHLRDVPRERSKTLSSFSAQRIVERERV